MLRSQRRLTYLLAALPVLVVLAALAYMVLMPTLEGEERGFWLSLGWAAETLSTTGYGGDSRWEHPAMVIFVVVLQFVGVFLVFLVFPIYLIPFLEERFEARLPKTAKVADGSVLIFHYGPPVTTLIRELARTGVPALVIEDEPDLARKVMDLGMKVLFGSMDEGSLPSEELGKARALVTNGSDDENAAIILAARQLGFEGDILALVEEPYHRRPMMLAGATAAYTPRHLLGAALAARASERISPRVQGVQALGRKLVVREVRIAADSPLAGKTLADARVGARTGVSIIGQWVEGNLMATPTADMRLMPGGILVLAGSAENVEGFGRLCDPARGVERGGAFVLAGYGEVGRKVAQLLRDAGEELLVIDRRRDEGVDLVGDILDHQVLEECRLRSAKAAIVAVDSDAATMFATVIFKEYAPSVPVIARVNQAENVERIHRAGADFALSISQVSGQMLAGRLLGQESISVDPQLKLQRVSARGLEEGHPSDLAIRERTGASVVAVERGDELLVEFDADFRFRAGDDVYICGSADATSRYLQLFPQE
ncbi:MAG: NAD-binding protein [Thermoanaerobaculia bacterium]|nr:NAD-binding protein [Thermoanaerobaculia bacterium]